MKDICTEDIILSSSIRGMNVLRNYLPPHFCQRAAKELWESHHGVVFIVTGFYVEGFAETDGPPGAHFMAKALDTLGFTPIILTDLPFEKLFQHAMGAPLKKSAAQNYLKAAMAACHPVCVISIERCGRDKKGHYRNLHGDDISAFTAPLDELFLKKHKDILRIGIGDGGNEIGMGNLKHIMPKSLGSLPDYFDVDVWIDAILRRKKIEIDTLRQHSFDLIPSVIEADHLILSTVSNWGAYGMMAELSMLSGNDLLPTNYELKEYLEYITGLGAIDSFSKKSILTVDGHSIKEDFKIIERLRALIKK